MRVRQGMPGERALDDITRADEQETNAQTPRGTERPADDGVGRLVATHGIHCDSEHERKVALSFQLSAFSKTLRSESLDCELRALLTAES